MNSKLARTRSRTWAYPSLGLGIVFLAAIVALAAAGCAAGTAEFRPPQSIDVGPPSAGAAYYALDVGDHHIGDAKVWTHGIKKNGKQSEPPMIRVGLRIRDDSPDPVQVDMDSTEVEVQTQDGSLFFQRVSSVSGNSKIEPRSTGRLLMTFKLPSGVKPHDVTAYEFNWTVENGDLRLSKSTPFFRKQDKEQVHYYFVDPGFSFYYGWGWPHLPPYWWW